MLSLVKKYFPLFILSFVFSVIIISENINAKSKLVLDVLNYNNNILKNLRKQIFYNLQISKNIKSNKAAYPLKFYTYRVRKNDNFFRIMTKTGQNADTLVSVNNLVSVYDIQAGQILKIPNFRGIFYKRKKNDSIESISRKFSLSASILASANYKQKFLKSGKIFLPGIHLSKEERNYYSMKAFINPLPQARISSRYGYRINPFTHRPTFHTGVDLAAPKGTRIKAAADGKVIWAARKGGYGNLIIIKHKKGYFSYYGHLSRFLVRRGRIVKRGEYIGRVGSTGLSTGPHLHFEIRKFGKTKSPLRVIHSL